MDSLVELRAREEEVARAQIWVVRHAAATQRLGVFMFREARFRWWRRERRQLVGVAELSVVG